MSSSGANKLIITIAIVACTLAAICAPAEAATFTRKTVAYAGDGGAGGDLPVPIAVPPSDYVGGYFYYCAAEPRWGEKCVDKVVTYDRFGKPRPPSCGWVDFEAHCGCDPQNLALRGVCKYHYH
jgi:hypothetical protein